MCMRRWRRCGSLRIEDDHRGRNEDSRFRKARIVDSAYYDGMGYGVLRAEWEARYPLGFAAFLPSAG